MIYYLAAICAVQEDCERVKIVTALVREIEIVTVSETWSHIWWSVKGDWLLWRLMGEWLSTIRWRSLIYRYAAGLLCDIICTYRSVYVHIGQYIYGYLPWISGTTGNAMNLFLRMEAFSFIIWYNDNHISHDLEKNEASSGVQMLVSIWNLAGGSASILMKHLSNTHIRAD